MKKWFSKHITHLFLVTQFFQPHWLLYQSKGRSRNIALQPINYIHVLANTISVPIQRLHPSKAAFKDRMHHCGTTKAVHFKAWNAPFVSQDTNDTINGSFVAQAIPRFIVRQWWLDLFERKCQVTLFYFSESWIKLQYKHYCRSSAAAVTAVLRRLDCPI